SSWIEVNLGTNKFIGSIVTLGHNSLYRYVKTFSLQYRSDGSDTWENYTDCNGNTKIFLANSSPLQLILNELKPGIEARYVRLYPLTGESIFTVRWELLSCSNCKISTLTAHTF
ncbi:hypothetical protein CAPTEDRAFT_121104, partial [Capitella teleta]